MEFLFVLSFVLIFILFLVLLTIQSNLKNQIFHLKKKVESLEWYLFEEKTSKIKKSKTKEKIILKENIHPPKTTHVISKKDIDIVKEKNQADVKQPEKKLNLVEQKYELGFWQKMESKFIANWTGILGTIIMVMGVGFLGVYTAIKMGAILRFLFIISFAGILFTIHFFLKSKKDWLNLALWLKSSSGAIILFAFLGASGAGNTTALKFIHNETLGLVLLALGIVINLYFSFTGKTQSIASLHTILSITALLAIETNPFTLITVTIVVLASLLLSLKDKWDLHFLITILAFGGYHLFWYFQNHSQANIDTSFSLWLTSVLSVLSVGIVGVLSHYRKIYQSKQFDVVAFLGHFTNWIILGTILYLYANEQKITTVILMVSASIIFALAIRAKRLNIRWLYITDTLIAQLITMLSIFSLNQWDVNFTHIVLLLNIEILIFLFIYTLFEKQEDKEENNVYPILISIGSNLYVFLGSLFFILSFFFTMDGSSRILHKNIILTFIVFLVNLAFHFYSQKNKYIQKKLVSKFMNNDKIDSNNIAKKTENQPDKIIDSFHRLFSLNNQNDLGISISGVFSVAFLFSIYIQRIHNSNIFFIAGFLFSILFILREKLRSKGLSLGLMIFIPLMLIVSWAFIEIQLWKNNVITNKTHLMATLFLILPLITNLFYSTCFIINKRIKQLKWPSLYLIFIHISIIQYYFLKNQFELLWIHYFLFISFIFISISIFLVKKYQEKYSENTVKYLLILSIISFFLFMIQFFNHHTLLNQTIFNIRIRYLSELLTGIFLVYFYLIHNETLSKIHIYKKVYSYTIEILFLFILISFFIELPIQKTQYILPIIAIIMMYLGSLSSRHSNSKHLINIERFQLYSILMHILSNLYLIKSFIFNKAIYTIDFLIIIILQLIYIIFFYMKENLADVNFIFPFNTLQKNSHSVSKNKTLWLLYPFYFSTTFFLIGNFESSILTLLLVIESFIIFIVGIILKESHFRYVSMGALVFCLVRLVFFDLSQSGTLTRAIVFLSVGGIMLFMNSLYNKYKDRF